MSDPDSMKESYVYLYDGVLVRILNEALDHIDNDDPNLDAAADAYVAVRVDELLRAALGVSEASEDSPF